MVGAAVPRSGAARGGVGPFAGAGPPVAGVNEVQTITFGGTGGTSTFQIRVDNQVTAPITWSATNNTLRDRIDAALELLSTIGTGGVTTAVGTMVSGIGTMLVTFDGALNSGKDVGLMVVEILTGALTASVAETTKGVPSKTAGGQSLQGAKPGALYVDTLNAILWTNAGTAAVPVWVRRGEKIIEGVLAAVDSAGGVLAIKNPEANPIIVMSADTYVTHIATGACSLDIGVGATATTKDDTLVDGVDVHTATGVFGRLAQVGANGVSPKLVPVGSYITWSVDSGASAGLTGIGFVRYYTAI
jgi:hypothetical protein